MKTRITSLVVSVCCVWASLTHAAVITVNTEDNEFPGPGQTSLLQALSNLQDGDTVQFNIPGPGPHYIKTPSSGYPYITNNNVTIDGYSQPGSKPNTNPLRAPNNAQIKIVLDSRDGGRTIMGNFDPGNGNSGYGTDETAILGVVDATHFNARGLVFLGSKATGDSFYCVSFARFATDAHIHGCWMGVDVDGTNLFGCTDGITGFRWRMQDGSSPALSDRLTIGVKAGSTNARAEFNVIVDMAIPIIIEGSDTRISGNFLMVLPDGLHDVDIAFTRPGEFEGAIEIGRSGNNTVIGTDGDGINDADEGNVMGGTVPDNLGGYDHTIEFYGQTPGTNIIVAGNYIGVGVDGSTRFTNGVPALNANGGAAQFRFGSDFDGVSDALEGNRVVNNWPLQLFPPSEFQFLSADLNFFDELSASGRVSARGNVLVNNFPFPSSPLRSGGTFLQSYYAQALNDPSLGVVPTLAADSTAKRLKGTVPVANATYPVTIIDVYVADPIGITNGQAAMIPELTNGFVQGFIYLGSLVEGSSADLNPTPGEFEFDTSHLPISGGYNITITANYSPDPSGTHNSAIVTSPFSDPLALPDFAPVSAASIGVTRPVPDHIIFNTGQPNLDNWEPYASVLGNSTFLIEVNTFAEPIIDLNQRFGLVFQPASGGPSRTGEVFYADDGAPFTGAINASRQNGNPGRVAGDKRPGAVNFIAGGEGSPHALPEFQSDGRFANADLYDATMNRYATVQTYSLDPLSLLQTPRSKAIDAINARVSSGVPGNVPEVTRFGGELAALDNGNFVVVVDDRSLYHAAGRAATAVIVKPDGTIVKDTFAVEVQDIWSNVAAHRGGFCVRVHSNLHFFDNNGTELGMVDQMNGLPGYNFDTGRGDGTRISGHINSPYIYLGGIVNYTGVQGPVRMARMAVYDSRTRSLVTETNISEATPDNGGADASDFSGLSVTFDRVALAVDALDRIAAAYEAVPANYQAGSQTVLRVLRFDPATGTIRFLTPSFFTFINKGNAADEPAGFRTFRPGIAMTTRQICVAAKGEINSTNNPSAGPDTLSQTTFYTVLSHPDPQDDPTSPAASAVELTITRSGNNIILSWPAASTGFVVQGATRLVPSDWADLSPQPPIVVQGGLNSVSVPIQSGLRFFRLKK
jgi:hypothetical protein